MTNKQAQITINSIKFMLDHAQYSDDVEEALNMAISALTAQSTMGQVFDRDTISRQAAIENSFEVYTKEYGWCEVVGVDAINSLPPAQPERPKGHWIIDGHHIRCSVCAEAMCNTDREGDKIPRNFCPNCGSDNRGGERNDEQANH